MCLFEWFAWLLFTIYWYIISHTWNHSGGVPISNSAVLRQVRSCLHCHPCPCLLSIVVPFVILNPSLLFLFPLRVTGKSGEVPLVFSIQFLLKRCYFSLSFFTATVALFHFTLGVVAPKHFCFDVLWRKTIVHLYLSTLLVNVTIQINDHFITTVP